MYAPDTYYHPSNLVPLVERWKLSAHYTRSPLHSVSCAGESTIAHSLHPPPVKRPATITAAHAFDVPHSQHGSLSARGRARHCSCQPITPKYSSDVNGQPQLALISVSNRATRKQKQNLTWNMVLF
jgi:hypothetical protein